MTDTSSDDSVAQARQQRPDRQQELLAHRAPVEAPMTLRFEVFPSDLDATVDFYVRVLAFGLTSDRRGTPEPYVSLRRGGVAVGAAQRPEPADRSGRRPPTGVELVLEVDDVDGERDRVARSGWPLVEDLRARPWGLRDFRLLDPSGYYLRVTSRSADARGPHHGIATNGEV